MSFKCPHCGGVLEVSKCVDLTKAKSVSTEKGDLSSGIVDATVNAIEKQVSSLSGGDAVIDSLTRLNNLANGHLGDTDSGLASGWGGAMVEALKSRRDEGQNVEAYAPEEIAKSDPDSLDKAAVAKAVQNMLHGALSKE